MRVTTVKCDVCGKVKGEGNGWFTCYATPIAFVIDRCATVPDTADREDICSDSCMMKRVSQVISSLHSPKSGEL